MARPYLVCPSFFFDPSEYHGLWAGWHALDVENLRDHLACAVPVEDFTRQ
ncbi:hypothetical protein [Streptomyces tubercidicus]